MKKDKKMNGKKIAIIINSLSLGGGAERMAAALADGLEANGHKIAFLLFNDFEQGYKTKADVFLLGDGQIPKSSFSALLAVFKRAKKIAVFCRDNNIDTCIAFMEEANFATVVSKIFFHNRAKIVCCLRNNPAKKKPVARFLIKRLYRWADLVVANSQAMADIVRKIFRLKNVKVIYNSIAYNLIADLKNEPLPVEYVSLFVGGRTFLNIGRLVAQKDQIALIEAFKIVLEKEPLARLAIIGEGELEGSLKKITVDSGLSDKVFFLGGQKNVFPFLKAAAAFVLSSAWEGLPNVILEALAVGTKVVSTDCPTGPREVLSFNSKGDALPLETERGILVKVGDSIMLAKAMIDSLARDKKEFIDDRFRSESVIAEWEKII